MQTGVSRVAADDDLDLFWGPLQVLPLGMRDLPMVLTMHDLVFHKFPETMSRRNRLILPRLVPPSLRRADLITVVSKTTGADLIETMGVAPEKVRVVPNGVSAGFFGQASAADSAVSRNLLFVGTREPRKNLSTLLDVLILLLESESWDGELNLVGLKGWGEEPLDAKLRHPLLAPRVRFAGYVDEADLPAVYRDSRLLVMPSLYEGFGLPVLEAMASGVPVVCSDSPPFPEIAGDAALQVQAKDAPALAEAIERCWNDATLRLKMIERGRSVASSYSWEQSAALLADCFVEAAG